tara:strand:+ start:203 stop:430 length:228 start_codon:yes stop_codon:yes gene_type:complete
VRVRVGVRVGVRVRVRARAGARVKVGVKVGVRGRDRGWGRPTSWSVLSSRAADMELLKSAAYSRTRRHTASGVAV